MDVSMVTPRQLRNPPIVEALVDFRAAVTAPQEAFEALAQALRSDYPKSTVRRGVKAELRVENGKLVRPTAEDLGFQGIALHNDDGTVIVQLSPEGFTFNNLKKYMGGDALLAEALKVWSAYVQAMQPVAITRIALKYVNQVKLPFGVGDEFTRFLTAPPPTPHGALEAVSEFLTRVVSHKEDNRTAVITTQKLNVTDPGPSSNYVLDVDAFVLDDFSVSANELRPILDSLREIKNQTFFAHLTEEAVELFV
jgi:uncharacterized protein (TIGR04255 family)